MAIAILLGVLGHATAAAIPILGAVAVAKLINNEVLISYELIITLAILCGIMRGVLRYFEQYLNHYIAFKLLATLRNNAFDKLRELDVATLEDKKRGGLLTLITSDIETLEVFYAHTISPVGIAIVISVVSLSLIWAIAGFPLALFALFGDLILGVLIPRINHRRLSKSGVEYRKTLSEFNSRFLDTVSGIREIVMKNAGSLKQKEVNENSNKLLDIMKMQNVKIARSNALIQLCTALITVVALLISITLMRQEGYSLGLAIIGFTILISTFGPVIALSSLPANLTQTLASANRLLDLMTEKANIMNVIDGQNIDLERVEIKNMKFSYGEDHILNDVTLKIEKGQIASIVGESGSGKSTILKLLLRERDINAGCILYNEINIQKINTESLLSNITLINQTTYLFDDTIEYNLKIAAPGATEDEIIKACKQASIHEFISSLEEGYKTRVGTLGDKLSTGEKQRIGLARAFLRGSSLILLDEPTSNVDALNECVILRALNESKKDKAIIIVSHRESTAAIADVQYKLENGILYKIDNFATHIDV
jgi:ATP-binding cassette subfamily C protein